MAKKKEIKPIEEIVEDIAVKPIEEIVKTKSTKDLDIIKRKEKELNEKLYSVNFRLSKINTQISVMVKEIEKLNKLRLTDDSQDLLDKIELKEKELAELERSKIARKVESKEIPLKIKETLREIDEVVIELAKPLLKKKAEIDLRKSTNITDELRDSIERVLGVYDELHKQEKELVQSINELNKYSSIVSLDINQINKIKNEILPNYVELQPVQIKQTLEYARLIKKYLDRKVK